MKPVVALLGRPNVGKSTLFNRITGSRQALVDNFPGVTRDRHYADAKWNDVEFTLIDNDSLSNTVVYKSAKPQDFEKSEKVVVVGKMQGNVFVADQILMKCPSKYEETEIKEEN